MSQTTDNKSSQSLPFGETTTQSSGSSKVMLSSGEGTVINAECTTSQDNDNPEKSVPKKSGSIHHDFILQFVDDFRLKANLYKEILQSIEQIDFNLDGSLLELENDSQNNEKEIDDNLYVSKLIAKSKESYEQISLLNTAEFEYFEKAVNHIKDIVNGSIDRINDEIHNFNLKDLV